MWDDGWGGAECKIVGPATLTLRTQHKTVSLDALPGEKADMRLTGSKILCADGLGS